VSSGPPVKLSDHIVGCFGDSVNRRQLEQRPAGAEGNSVNPFAGKRGKLESEMKRWPFDWLETIVLAAQIVFIGLVGVITWLIVFEE
jgi:hypothetical protein